MSHHGHDDNNGCRHVTSSRGGARTLKGHFQMYYPPFNSRCHSFNIPGVSEGGQNLPNPWSRKAKNRSE